MSIQPGIQNNDSSEGLVTPEHQDNSDKPNSVVEKRLQTDQPMSRSRSSTTSAFLRFIHHGSYSDLPASSKSNNRMISLFRLLLIELNLPGPTSSKRKSKEDEEAENQAYEQLSSMVLVPLYLEKFIVYGLLVCLNSLLTLFTLIPLKICIITYTTTSDLIRLKKLNLQLIRRNFHFVKRDILTLMLIVLTIYTLGSPLLDISRLYHDIRGQAHIKLYVMFGVLEVTDKLLSSIGLEIFTVLVGIPLTDGSPENMLKLFLFLLIALVYSTCHSYALIYQCVSLHVAANSYSNALLALLLSNQFAELKGAVFKKFDKEGLFQVSMSDLTERFQLSIMLFIITLRNLSQLGSTQLGLIPDSWKSWNKWFGAIFGPSMVVLGSEVFVDWLKHCFINKFNRIRPTVYDNFLYVLSLDFHEVFISNSKLLTLREASDYLVLAKRIGLPIISLAICFLRMSLSDLKNVFWPASVTFMSLLSSLALLCLTFIALLVMRLMISLWLLKWGRRIKRNHEARQSELVKKSSHSFMTPDHLQFVSSSVDVDSPLNNDLSDDSNISIGVNTESDLTQAFIDLPTLGASFIQTSLQTTIPSTHDQISCSKDLLENEILRSFIPGVPNTEMSSINPSTRSYIYDYGEKIPPTLEEKRNAEVKKRRIGSPIVEHPDNDSLSKVKRYEMASKRIW